MLKTGTLSERMFHYPQPFGSEGLVFNRQTKQSNSYGAQEFYRNLGVEPHAEETGRAFAQRVGIKNDSVDYRDLYLAALLLDKELDTFVKETSDLAVADTVLPTHYQEAWLLYNEQHPQDAIAFAADSAIVKRFAGYRALQKEHADNPIVASNLGKRKFGNTYWYYFDY